MDPNETSAMEIYRSRSLGPLIVVSMFSSLLQGVNFCQTYAYFQAFPKDGVLLKVFVSYLNFLGSLQAVMSVYTAYYYAIIQYTVSLTVWSERVLIFTNALVAISAQLFFWRRLWIISRNVPLIVLVGAFGCAEFGATIAGTVQLKPTPLPAPNQLTIPSPKADVAVFMGLVSAALCDATVTAGLWFYLRRHRIRNAHSSPLLRRIISWNLNTGLIPTFFVVANIVALVSPGPDIPVTNAYLVFYNIASQAYIMSAIGSLNFRIKLRQYENVSRPTTTDPEAHSTSLTTLRAPNKDMDTGEETLALSHISVS